MSGAEHSCDMGQLCGHRQSASQRELRSYPIKTSVSRYGFFKIHSSSVRNSRNVLCTIRILLFIYNVLFQIKLHNHCSILRAALHFPFPSYSVLLKLYDYVLRLLHLWSFILYITGKLLSRILHFYNLHKETFLILI